MMSGIRVKDTKPELLVRRALHAKGFRFRLHVKDLPGRPDIVLRKHQAVVLVHGCFWHGHDCRYFKPPSTRPEFWLAKIGRNRANDLSQAKKLMEQGRSVAHVWECVLRQHHHVAGLAKKLSQGIWGNS